uniref:Glutamyl-tRNA(Gln) amidotransferase subunit A, mitochondrial n=1 Tax=Aplanochytrium stocchinoi TaxID=215587 RepID=A0A7S3LQ72_9STRA
MNKIVLDAARAVHSRKATCLEVVEECIEVLNSEKLKWSNAFICTAEEKGMRKAAEASDYRREKEKHRSLLDGIPIAVKDNFCTANLPTTAASKTLRGFEPGYNATSVAKLLEAGAIICGKTNMDEFGMGSAGLNSDFGATKNPIFFRQQYISNVFEKREKNDYCEDKKNNENDFYIAGGSSSGSAAAVASGACFAALGSDTGGSVRLPAAYCGIVGLKPSYGRVSRWGLIPYASSLDTPGILASNVQNASLVLDIIAGPDERDSTSFPQDYVLHQNELKLTESIKNKTNLEGVRIGLPVEFFVDELPETTVETWKLAANMLEDAGASVVEISIPSIVDALPAYYVIASAEASSNLSRYDGVQFGFRDLQVSGSLEEQYKRTRTVAFGEEVQRRILMGSHVLSSGAIHDFYERAVSIRRKLKQEFDTAFQSLDALITPVTPFEIPRVSEIRRDPVENYLMDVMTVPASLAGLPAMSVPFMPPRRAVKGIDFSLNPSLCSSIQVIAPYGMERSMIKIASALES